MGVPKFFRWISERYPCLSVSVNNNQIPNFDCLYLDMNGIIHICSHPDDTNVHFRITEEDIFSNIFTYIEFLFKTVKPKDVFFLAVDGVAPRAKMNQQRARRFKSAKEAINREIAAMQSGIVLPDEKRFDSNAITPGTEFMDRLQKRLLAFLDEKIKTDSLWQGVDVILSGHETPGEGEHKIQEFIRYRRSLPSYNPNTKHCLYGLDADLMLLGLASHEPYFSLLREEVTFSKKKSKRAYIAEESKFFLLHLSLLREYIDYEFSALKTILGSEYSLERIIDDWIIMSFLVGNDFVPHLPKLHIHTSALPFLWETYIKTRPQLKGYINDCGKLDLENLLQYIDALSSFDVTIFLEDYEDMKWMLGKTGERLANELENLDKKPAIDDQSIFDVSLCNMFDDEVLLTGKDFDGPDVDLVVKNLVEDSRKVNVENNLPTSDEVNIEDILILKEEINESEVESSDTPQSCLLVPFEDLHIDRDLMEFDFEDNEEILDGCLEENTKSDNNNKFAINANIEGGDDEMWELQYRCYKRDYYYSKLGLTATDEVLIEQAKEYMTALQWISYYYFCGVPSWSWFYPQHYAPFISDLTHLSNDIRQNGITFDIGRPFLPFEQLMAVLPADSGELLPLCFRILMTEENSPIIDFYPKTFKTDLNGKKKDWEAVVLIPFIDEKRLLEALETKKPFLSESECQRNVHGPHLKLRYSNSTMSITEINPDIFRIPISSIVPGLCSNVHLDVICQGFPTFNHVEHTFALEKAGVKIFEFSANSSSIVLRISPPTEPIVVENIAQKYIGKIAYVNWPAFIEVKVVAILDDEYRFSYNSKTKELTRENHKASDIEKIKEFRSMTPKSLFRRSAISIDESNFVILETLHSGGKTYEISGTHKAGSTIRLEHNWDTNKKFWYLHQLSVLKESIDFFESNPVRACTKLNQLFPKFAVVFCLDTAHYGHSASVVSINNLNASVNVRLNTLREPIYPNIELNVVEHEYMNANRATEYIDIHPLLFSRITGTLYINLTQTVSSESGNLKTKRNDRNRSQCAIGLDLKNNKFNLQIPGWVVKVKCENHINKWLYSMKVIDILREYREKFPEVFDFIQKPHFESLCMEDMFDKESISKKVIELQDFLSNLPYKNLERISNENQIICESNISILEKCADEIKLKGAKSEKLINVELAFDEIYRPHHSLHGVKPDRLTEFKLLDRVVCTTDGYTVPLRLRGVVIGIEPRPNDDLRLEVLFDKEFKSAISIRGSKPRCYRMPPHTLINVTYGARKSGKLANNAKKSENVEKHPDFNTNHKQPQAVKKTNHLTEFTSRTVNVSASSDNFTGFLNTRTPTHSQPLPPMPSNEFLEERMIAQKTPANQKRFIAHCNEVFTKQTGPKQFSTVININNCIPEYSQLFQICLQSSITNPQVTERHCDQSFFMSFTSSLISVPEHKESSLDVGRVNLINRVWNVIFPQWGQQLNGYAPYQHHYMPEHFDNNPFMQVYPQQSRQNSHGSRHQNNTSPRHKHVTATENVTTRTNHVTKERGKESNKRFIPAPKPRGNLFN